MDKKLVFVAMSGGVDSSVAAALLKKAGFNVAGVFMKNWSASDLTPGCSSEKDARDARMVASVLNIPFYVFDFEKDYKEKIIDPMIEGYRNARTPNPDILCNKEIKFGLFLEKARALGADFIATGHYVKKIKSKNEKGKNKFKLLKAKDKDKDQSYFLYLLNQDQLKYALFPIGDYLKSEVRELARKFNLPTAAKKDSQGLCFVGKIKMRDFLKNEIPEREGAIVTTQNQTIGRHSGVSFYTVGQKAGVGGTGPYFVASRDIEGNRLIVAKEEEKDFLFAKNIFLDKIHWISDPPTGKEPKFPFECLARIRYRQSLNKAKIMKNEKGFLVEFDNPQWAPASGQHVVFYLPAEALAKEGKEEIIGGGEII